MDDYIIARETLNELIRISQQLNETNELLKQLLKQQEQKNGRNN